MKQYIGTQGHYLENDGDDLVINANLNIRIESGNGIKFGDGVVGAFIYASDDTQIAQIDPTGTVDWGTTQTFTGGLSMGNRLHIKKGSNVASASVITLGAGNFFYVTGTTTVTGIVETGWGEGDSITLYSVDGFDITADGTPVSGLPIKLVGGSNPVVAGDIVHLTLIDGFWRGRIENF